MISPGWWVHVSFSKKAYRYDIYVAPQIALLKTQSPYVWHNNCGFNVQTTSEGCSDWSCIGFKTLWCAASICFSFVLFAKMVAIEYNASYLSFHAFSRWLYAFTTRLLAVNTCGRSCFILVKQRYRQPDFQGGKIFPIYHESSGYQYGFLRLWEQCVYFSQGRRNFLLVPFLAKGRNLAGYGMFWVVFHYLLFPIPQQHSHYQQLMQMLWNFYAWIRQWVLLSQCLDALAFSGI